MLHIDFRSLIIVLFQNNDTRGFSKCFANLQFGKLLYVMVRRLPERFTGECSQYFRCLCVLYRFVNAFVHQNMKGFVHKH